jgi:alpha-L-rhamnosidase
MLNRMHEMFAYTLKCLILGGKIVDCPSFERLGYGGDGNTNTMVAQTLFDLNSLYTTWLTNWKDCIRPDGSLPHNAPVFWFTGGGPYWCAFIIKAAWETYLNYGDPRILENFYPTMLHWLEYVQKYSPTILLEKWPETDRRWWYLGDWATPEGIDQYDPRSVNLVANCAIMDSYDKMVKIAGVLNNDSDSALFLGKKNELAQAIHKTFNNPDSATYGSGVQIDLVYPLILGIVPDSLEEKVINNLYSETLDRWEGHFATGLVGLRILTDWVIDNEASDLMYTMMTKEGYPGFLYMFENGATTTWEHWDGTRSRIHSTYNSPGTWLYQSIGGIRPMEEYPGYRRFLLAPRPPETIDWAKITKETPYGTIKVEWQKENEQTYIQASIPVGSTAYLLLPQGVGTCMINDTEQDPDRSGVIMIESGTYNIRY